MPIPKDKRKFALWLYPETLDKIGSLYTADDCRSKSEFIEKAVQFYIDHLAAEDKRSMLPNAMLSSMKSIVAESDNRICRLLFKMAVELAVTMNVVAANSDIDDITLERLKIYDRYYDILYVNDITVRHCRIVLLGNFGSCKGFGIKLIYRIIKKTVHFNIL